MSSSTYIKTLAYNFHAILSKIDENFSLIIFPLFGNKTLFKSNHVYSFVNLLKYASASNRVQDMIAKIRLTI